MSVSTRHGRSGAAGQRRATVAVFALVPLLATGALAPPAPAQEPLFAELHRMLPGDEQTTRAMALGDVDGDGDVDVLTGKSHTAGNQNRLYLNDGSGVFTDATATHMPMDADTTWSIALGDVDADGDLDALFGNISRQDQLYLNDGAGVFTDATATHMPSDSRSTTSVALGDVDGDGDLDALFGRGGFGPTTQEPNRLYLNDGSGVFTDAEVQFGSDDNTSSVALGDVDGDGDLDAMIGNSGYWSGSTHLFAQNRLFLNNGSGLFTDVSHRLLSGNQDSTRSVALGDVDGDGDLDALIGNNNTSSTRERLWLNDGSGVFTDATSTHLPAGGIKAWAAALADVDGDGDLDALLGGDSIPVQPSRLYLNDGNGVFTDATAAHLPPNSRTFILTPGDVDGDGDLDLVIGADDYGVDPVPDRLWLNDGSGVFADAKEAVAPFGGTTKAAAVGDVDLDGDVDVMLGGRLYLNNGSGAFADTTATHMPSVHVTPASIALGDVDGDRDLDAVIGQNQPTRLYLNDGSGVFTDVSATHLPVVFSGRKVALGDVDLDGDLDAFIGTDFQDRLYVNDGSGTFTDATAQLPAGSHSTSSVALGDINGDGDLDIFVGSFSQDRLYVNDGNGTFTDATAQLPLGGSNSLALGDLDGDGDLDAMIGSNGQDRLYLNDGSGVFADVTTTHMPPNTFSTESIALGDVDVDGDLDAIIGHALYLNDGSGVFIDATATHIPNAPSNPSSITLVDMDEDGDLDTVMDFALLTNLTRQVAWRGLPRLGKRLTLEHYGTPGGQAQLLLAAGAGRFDLPFGTLLLDPTTMVPAGAHALDAQGQAAVTFIVPANPSFLGVSLYWQAVVASPLALTNLEITMLTGL